MAAAVLLLCFLAQAPAPPAASSANAENTAPSARLEGRVVSLSGEPLRKAVVRLQMVMSPPAPGSTGMPSLTNYTSTSDAEGNFVFEEVEPSRYNITAERAGYVRLQYGAKGPNLPATPVTLSAGQKMTGMLLKMTPQAIISGKIADDEGDPVAGVLISVYRMGWNQGRRQLMPAASGASTQADGSFTVANLAAGKYYIAAMYSRMSPMGTRERPGKKGPVEEFVTTYYPNSIEPAQASSIEVTPGIDVRGIDIRLRKARVFRISGRIAASGPLPSNTMLMVNPAGSMDYWMLNRSMTLVRDKDGSFEIGNLTPGNYVVQTQPGATFRPPDGTAPVPVNGRLQVSITNENVENLVLPLGPGAEITGQFALEGVGPLTAAARAKLTPAAGAAVTDSAVSSRLPSVSMIIAEGLQFSAPNSQTKDDGSFLIKGVFPDRYRVTYANLPPDCYVKQVRFAGQDVTNALLDLTAVTAGHLDVVLSPAAAQVSGTVRNDKGDLAKDTQLTLWQTGDPAPGVQEFLRSARTDEKGSFRFANLPPGEYRVIAWEQVEPGMSNDRDFRTKFESKASVVKVQENARESVEPKLLPFDAIETEAAKIR